MTDKSLFPQLERKVPLHTLSSVHPHVGDAGIVIGNDSQEPIRQQFKKLTQIGANLFGGALQSELLRCDNPAKRIKHTLQIILKRLRTQPLLSYSVYYSRIHHFASLSMFVNAQ